MSPDEFVAGTVCSQSARCEPRALSLWPLAPAQNAYTGSVESADRSSL